MGDDSSSSGGTYKPAESGMAKYFFAMLDDRDRNARYNEAIRACVADFKEAHGRGPRVLDVGVGTGYLSQCCLLAGAKHVIGVDVRCPALEPPVPPLAHALTARPRLSLIHI